ncbi:MAG: hypothetical protein SPLM_09910 [Spiroplasma phoeniceum]|uniref:hypothetical protein n=1 Tax=Spiroplasma phoeniceum TaxID=47835 RepID=UPI003133E08B
MNITESIKFNKLQEENELLKKELAEKDAAINKILMICNNYGEEFEPKCENINVIIKNHIENLEELIDCLNNIINEKK